MVHTDRIILGKGCAEIAIKAFGPKGTAVLFGGTPGNPSTFHEHKGSKEVFAKYPGWNVIMGGDTSWTQQGGFEAMSAVLAKGVPFDIVIFDNAATCRGMVRAFQQAGKPIQAMTGDAANGFFKDWEELSPTNPKFRVWSWGSCTWYSRVALTVALEAKQGKTVPSQIFLPQPLFELKKGLYDPTMPDNFGFPIVPKSLEMQILR